MENISNKPLISVIMGVYNSKKIELLKKSIESILSQTYENFEFIICDDCSTKEEVKQILNEYRSIDKRIILLKNEINSGLAYSLNRCIEIAKGEYIARQDDDDISVSNRFEIQIEFLEKNKDVSLVGCNLNLFDSNSLWGKRIHKEFPTKKDFLYGSQFPHPATIIRKDILNKIGNYSVTKITRRTEDYDLYMRLYYYEYKGVNLQMFLYDYYEDSITYSQQKFRYRIDEAKLRFYWFRKLKLMPKGIIYVIKPIISGLTPNFIRKKYKRKQYKMEF